YDASVEAIVRLKPDLVLAGKSTRIVGRLESLGIQVIALEPQNLADVERSLHVIAQALHLPQADAKAKAVWSSAMLSVESAAKMLPAHVRGNSIYFEASTGGYAAGESSFIGGIISQLGLRNIVDKRMGAFPQINPEFVVRAKPHWIVLAEPMAQSLARRPGWSNMDAVKSHRVCQLSAAQGHMLVRPGPRIGEAAQILAACFNQSKKP
ncbi:MAG: ABC transporter substrate-binding protein, partial [Limnohabitans sp.]